MATIMSRAGGDAGATAISVASPREAAAAKRETRKAMSLAWEEMWRQIYTPLLQSEGKQPQIIAVSSALDGEGKTTVALGLALAMAKDLEKSVLLLDCNLLRPGLSEALGIKEALGLTNFLAGEISLEAATRRTRLDNLWIVPAGLPAGNASRLVRSSSMVELAQSLRAKHDIIVMDTPSMLSSSDARMLISHSDDVLFVVRVGLSTTKSLAKAISLVRGAHNRGIVVNDFRSAVPKFLRRFLLSV